MTDHAKAVEESRERVNECLCRCYLDAGSPTYDGDEAIGALIAAVEASQESILSEYRATIARMDTAATNMDVLYGRMLRDRDRLKAENDALKAERGERGE